MIEVDRIIQGDCLDAMAKMPEKSIDLIIADPPYNIGKAKWDKIDNYLEWAGQWIKACERVLKDNGSFYWFHNKMPVIARLMCWIEEETVLQFAQLITWCKIGTSFKNKGFVMQRLSNGTMRNYYSGFTEYCLFYSFDDLTGNERLVDIVRPLSPMAAYLSEEIDRAGIELKEITKLFPSKTGGITGCVWNWLNGMNFPTEEQYSTIRKHLNGRMDAKYLRREYEDLRREYEDLRREYEDLRREYEDLRRPFNLTQTCSNIYMNSNCWVVENEGDILHPTQKSLALIENIVKHSSNEGNLILDPFLGSGTTAVAAKRLGRHYIGIEKETEYCEIARQRVEAVGKGQLEFEGLG